MTEQEILKKEVHDSFFWFEGLKTDEKINFLLPFLVEESELNGISPTYSEMLLNTNWIKTINHWKDNLIEEGLIREKPLAGGFTHVTTNNCRRIVEKGGWLIHQKRIKRDKIKRIILDTVTIINFFIAALIGFGSLYFTKERAEIEKINKAEERQTQATLKQLQLELDSLKTALELKRDSTMSPLHKDH